MFREGSAELVKDVFGQHVRPQDRIIEIGSGLGELVTLVPEYEGQIQQTERDYSQDEFDLDAEVIKRNHMEADLLSKKGMNIKKPIWSGLIAS